MRLFDYKFLILLGLTLVVYFIYREVEYLRRKVDKLESELNQKKLLLNNSSSLEINDQNSNIQAQSVQAQAVQAQAVQAPNPNQTINNFSKLPNNSNVVSDIDKNIVNNNKSVSILQNPITSPQLKKSESVQRSPSKSPLKLIHVDLKSHSTESSPSDSRENKILTNSAQSGVKAIKDKIINILQEDSEESDNEGTTTELLSESSKPLAIYSNDNELEELTQNSLMESVEATKNAVYFNYTNIPDIPDLKKTMNDLINSLSSDEEFNEHINQSEHTNHLIDTNSEQAMVFLEQKNKQLEIEEIIVEKDKQLSEMSQKSNKSSEKELEIAPEKELEKPSDEELTKPSDEELIKPSDEELTKPSDEELTKPSDEELEKPSDEELEKTSEAELEKTSEKPSENASENALKKVSELNGKPISEIKTIAKKLLITLSKKINGRQKYKSKDELIKEILQK